MSRLAFVLAVLVTTGVSRSAPVQDASTKVKLSRTYASGFSQDYTFEMTIDVAGMKFNMSGALTESVKKLLENGAAEIEEKITKLKATFDGEEAPEDELPEPEVWPRGPNGVPTKLGEDADSLAVAVYVSSYLPNQEIDLNGKYTIKWEPSDTKYKVEGNGTLIATGRLYEERVAKIEIDATISHPEQGPTQVMITTYTALDTGKLVRALGKISAEEEGEKLEATYEIRKVRK